MSLFDQFAKSRGEWLRGTGPQNDVVISSRIRLARNLATFPFLSKTDESDRLHIFRTFFEKIEEINIGDSLTFIDMEETDELDRLMLVERHLISRHHAESEGSRGVALLPNESVALMINEEDHLRIQVLRSGMQLEPLWDEINAIDNDLQSRLDFAFHAQYGYLTACPTNVGTGIRVSVMLHLPALKLTGELEKVARAAKDMRLAIRGLHGEGTEATGDFYQISNQTTLGKTELEIIEEFCDVVIPKIVDYEKMAREALAKERPTAVDDKIWRAYGVLKHARNMSTEEALFMLSHVRMGYHMGRFSEVPIETINNLFLQTQPAHLQKFCGQVMDGEARSIARAELIRQQLSQN